MASPSDEGDSTPRQHSENQSPRTEPITASLFVTCIVDQFYPDVGESTVRVLRGLGVDVAFPEGQTCCGQPAYNAGYVSLAADAARRTLDAFRGTRYVVVPSGSCAAMVKVFYPELLSGDPAAMAEAHDLADRTYELSQFIVDVLGQAADPLLPADASVRPLPQPAGEGWDGVLRMAEAAVMQGSLSPMERVLKVTYHEGCHLRRELGAVTQPRTLVESLPGVALTEMEYPDECCGFGGAFSVKFADISGAMLADKLDRIEATGADAVVACDSSCLMQIEGGLRKRGSAVRALHLAELLDSRSTSG